MDQATYTNNGESAHTHTLSEDTQKIPLPIATAMAFPATQDWVKADHELVHLCEQHIINRQALEACPLEADKSPYWPPYESTSDAISKIRPMTLTGLAAKARAAKREALVQGSEEDPRNGSALEWAWDLVNDLIRLDGGVV